MHHNLIIKDGDTTKVVKEVLVDGVQFVDEKPLAGSTNPVTSGGVRTSIKENTKNILDDGDSESESIQITTDAEGASAFAVGHYFEKTGQVFICTSITNDGDVYTVEGDKQNGLVPVINSLVDRIAAIENE